MKKLLYMNLIGELIIIMLLKEHHNTMVNNHVWRSWYEFDEWHPIQNSWIWKKLHKKES